MDEYFSGMVRNGVSHYRISSGLLDGQLAQACHVFLYVTASRVSHQFLSLEFFISNSLLRIHASLLTTNSESFDRSAISPFRVKNNKYRGQSIDKVGGIKKYIIIVFKEM